MGVLVGQILLLPVLCALFLLASEGADLVSLGASIAHVKRCSCRVRKETIPGKQDNGAPHLSLGVHDWAVASERMINMKYNLIHVLQGYAHCTLTQTTQFRASFTRQHW